MQALQQITAMTMCSAADESGLSSSSMDGGKCPGGHGGATGGPRGDMWRRIHTVLNVLTIEKKGFGGEKEKKKEKTK